MVVRRHKEEVQEHEEAEKHRQEEAAELQRRLAYAEAQVTKATTACRTTGQSHEQLTGFAALQHCIAVSSLEASSCFEYAA